MNFLGWLLGLNDVTAIESIEVASPVGERRIYRSMPTRVTLVLPDRSRTHDRAWP